MPPDIPREQRTLRTVALLGPEAADALARAHVMLFGVGGVGGYAAEALARAGIGRLTLVDADTVSPSNLNRQLVALGSTLGRPKARVMAERIRDFAPDAQVAAVERFHLPSDPVPIPADVDLVLDAVDTVTAKVDLAAVCQARGLPLVSCMGMGNRLDPTRVRVGDLFATNGCPLCRVMRRELRKRGVSALRCVYSDEPARAPVYPQGNAESKAGRPAPGSLCYVPATAGLYLAYEAVRLLTARQNDKSR